MSQNKDMEEFYDCADQFVNLANELSQKDSSGKVGSALRFAAARYSAFESSLMTQDLAKDKEAIKEKFLKDYDLMLEENIQAYIEHLKNAT